MRSRILWILLCRNWRLWRRRMRSLELRLVLIRRWLSWFRISRRSLLLRGIILLRSRFWRVVLGRTNPPYPTTTSNSNPSSTPTPPSTATHAKESATTWNTKMTPYSKIWRFLRTWAANIKKLVGGKITLMRGIYWPKGWKILKLVRMKRVPRRRKSSVSKRILVKCQS